MASINTGLFVATTDNYDLTRLEGKDLGSLEFKQFMIKLMQRTNQIAIALNLKDSAMYYEQEFVNGQTFFPNPALGSNTPQSPTPRQVFRRTYSVGALPNAAVKTVPHGLDITSMFTFTRIYGASSNTTGLEYIPLPFFSTVGANIELEVDGTNIYITTTTDGTLFDTTYIILEYLKN